MFLMGVNVLVYAHREDTPEHSAYREWLESTMGISYFIDTHVLIVVAV